MKRQWYIRNGDDLPKWHKDTPIFCKRPQEKDIQMLVPCIQFPQPENRATYAIIGFNWFHITTGQWGSCTTWETIEEAIQCRLDYGYEVFHGNMKVTKVSL